MYQKYAQLLDAEADKQRAMALIAQDQKIKADHEELMLALWHGAEVLRREAKPCQGHCPRSGMRWRLRRMPFLRVEFYWKAGH